MEVIMPEQNVSLESLVKDSIRSSHKSSSEIADAIANVASANLKLAIREAESLKRDVVAIVRGSLEGVHDMGGDARTAAQGTLLGLARMLEQAGEDSVEVLRLTAQAVIQITAQLHGDIAQAARGIVDGAAVAANCNREAAHSSAVAAAAAVAAAEAIDARTAELVKHAIGHARLQEESLAGDRHAKASTPP
jgi:hypothetical protein